MTIALNHMVAPRLGHRAFFAMAKGLGVDQVEIRNDLSGVATLDGTPAAKVAVGRQSGWDKHTHHQRIAAFQRLERRARSRSQSLD